MKFKKLQRISQLFLLGILMVSLIFLYNLSKTELVTKGHFQCRCFGLSAITGDSPYPDLCLGFFTYQCQSIPLPSPSSSPTIQTYNSDYNPDTSTWETYTNPKFGFSFKYPESFISDWKPTDLGRMFYSCSNTEDCNLKISFYVRPNLKQLDLETLFLKEVCSDCQNNKVKVDDLVAFTVSFFERTGIYMAKAYIPLKTSKDILVLSVDWNYGDSVNEEKTYAQLKQLRDQILSTFKFTN